MIKIDRSDPLFRQLLATDPQLNLNRLIPVGPHELEAMIGEKLGLPPGWIDVPRFPYSVAQLRKITESLEEEESQAVLTVDLPQIAEKPVDLRGLASWFGYSSQDPSYGKVRDGLLNLNVHISRGDVAELSERMGTLTQVAQWRIRYLNLPPWSSVSGYRKQVAEVQKRGFIVTEAIADCWSMLVARLFLMQCGENAVLRSDHSGSTATMFREEPLIVYNLQYQIGLDIGPNAEGGTHACCEVPPLS